MDAPLRLLRVLVLIGFSFAGVLWAQDDEPGQTGPESVAAEPEEAVDSAEPEINDSDLDEQVYEDEDDDFRPSEEIPADQSIAFPTDI